MNKLILLSIHGRKNYEDIIIINKEKVGGITKIMDDSIRIPDDLKVQFDRFSKNKLCLLDKHYSYT